MTSMGECAASSLACGVDRAAVERILAEDPVVVAGGVKYTVKTIDPGRVRPAL
ncbi:hypothetical protein [Actinomadura formosensis]|uniref:hypothetical protein n=1 Tax=Actinomadura formosensis TaxID=60706 RepID=UPI003D90C577